MHTQDFANTSLEAEVDAESGQKSRLNDLDLDAEIKKLADAETDRQAHLGYDLQATVTEEVNEKRLLRKIDWRVMPVLMFTYGLQVNFLSCRISAAFINVLLVFG